MGIDDFRAESFPFDSITLTEGRGSYSVRIPELKLAYISFGTDKSKAKSYPVFFMPGERADMEFDGHKLSISGTDFYTQVRHADEAVASLNQEREERMVELNRSISEHKGKTDSLSLAMRDWYEAHAEKMKDVAVDYIDSHSDEEGAAWLLMLVPNTDELSSHLSDRVRNDSRMTKLINYLVGIELSNKNRKSADAIVLKVGMRAPDFTLERLDGSTLSLRSLRGKYVILDFWGSWCHECIAGFPKMKEYYEKYHGQFEVVGVDCFDTKAKWQGAVERYGLPWINVYNSTSDKLNETYGVQGYPTKVVVHPTGLIMYISKGETDAFYEALDRVFGGKK